MSTAWEEAKKRELEVEAHQQAAARRFNALDTQRMLERIKTWDFPDEWLEEIESEANK